MKKYFKDKLLLTSILLTVVRCILVLSLSIVGTIKLLSVNIFDSDGGTRAPNAGETILICFMFIAIFIMYLILSLSSLMKYILQPIRDKQSLWLAIFSINIELVIFNLMQIKKIKIIKKPKKWNIFDICSMGVLLGVYLILSYVSGFIPPMPFWITLSIKYIPLFFGTFLLTFTQSVTLCLIAGIVPLIMPGTAIYTAYQYILDYFIPISSIALASLFVPTNLTKSKFKNYIFWSGFITLPIIIIFLSRVLAGVVFWLNPNAIGSDPSYAFEWKNTLVYSLIYNSFNTMFDYVIYMITVPIICENLKFLKTRFQNQVNNMEME